MFLPPHCRLDYWSILS